ncbi:MAG: leucine-rich repeat protein [Eubacteriales bacterium]
MTSTCTITGCSTLERDIIVPSEINGYTVTAIGDFAFADRSSLESISLPEGLKSIGNYAL